MIAASPLTLFVGALAGLCMLPTKFHRTDLTRGQADATNVEPMKSCCGPSISTSLPEQHRSSKGSDQASSPDG